VYDALPETAPAFEEFSELEDILARSRDLGRHNFISTWAFTESPLALREQFLEVLERSDAIMIVSNSRLGDVDNFAYLEALADQLETHKHASCDLSFLENAKNFQKRHQLHVFVKEQFVV